MVIFVTNFQNKKIWQRLSGTYCHMANAAYEEKAKKFIGPKQKNSSVLIPTEFQILLQFMGR